MRIFYLHEILIYISTGVDESARGTLGFLETRRSLVAQSKNVREREACFGQIMYERPSCKKTANIPFSAIATSLSLAIPSHFATFVITATQMWIDSIRYTGYIYRVIQEKRCVSHMDFNYKFLSTVSSAVFIY